MTQTTSTKTISILRQLFASYGFPDQIVSDNVPQFISKEFKDFMQANGIRHIRSAPYHPASNGLVERFVRTFKEAMKAGKHDNLSLSHRVQNFLFTYRTTPHSTTKVAPCMLFLKRGLRTRLDLLRPKCSRHCQGQTGCTEDASRSPCSRTGDDGWTNCYGSEFASRRCLDTRCHCQDAWPCLLPS